MIICCISHTVHYISYIIYHILCATGEVIISIGLNVDEMCVNGECTFYYHVTTKHFKTGMKAIALTLLS